jgi:hypothetical protein
MRCSIQPNREIMRFGASHKITNIQQPSVLLILAFLLFLSNQPMPFVAHSSHSSSDRGFLRRFRTVQPADRREEARYTAALSTP